MNIQNRYHQQRPVSFFYLFRKRKLVIPIYATIALVLAGCTFGRQTTAEPAPVLALPTALPVASQTTYKVQQGTVSDTASFVGKVAIAVETDLFFGTAGRIERLHVDSGDIVEANTIVATLDAEGFGYELESARLSLELAQQRLAKAKAALELELQDAQFTLEIAKLRQQSMENEDEPDEVALAIQELRVRQAEITLQQLQQGVSPELETNLKQAELTIARLESSLQDLQIIAPIPGEVRFFDNLQVGNQLRAFEPAATIVDPDSLRVEANLVREDLEKLSEGMAIRIQPLNQPSLLLDGTIQHLPQPFGSGNGPLAEISIDESNVSDLLRAGTSVNILAELGRVEDALWLPPAAVQGFSGNYFVVAYNEGVQTEVDVDVGIYGDERIEITSGLLKGQEVLGK